MLCTGNNFGNIRLKQKELLERIIGNFKSIMYLSLVYMADYELSNFPLHYHKLCLCRLGYL